MPRQPELDVIVQAAAMSDFRPKAPADRKIKKDEGLEIILEPTHDFSVDLGKAKEDFTFRNQADREAYEVRVRTGGVDAVQ